ncbi:MAG: MBL fold metallo-hydrolase, partial [Candidatus Manganitrophaceae bacterium]
MSPLEVRFLDVGYGDAIVLRLPEGGAVLIDGGRPEKGPRLLATLCDMGVDRVDTLLITHFHPDHTGGLGAILDQFLPFPSKGERPAMILLPLFPKTVEPEVETVLRKTERRSYRAVRRGEIIPL